MALALDIAGLLLPGATGLGAGGRALMHADDIIKHGDDVLDIIKQANSNKVNLLADSDKLYRYGDEAHSVERLAEEAARAKAHRKFNIHGVSTTTNPKPTNPSGSATVAEVQKIFSVHKTGTNPDHYTVEIPSPVTQKVADAFNKLFGFD